MKLYITTMSLFALLIFYVPLVLFVLWKIVRKPMSTTKKSLVIVLFLLLAYAIPLGDVTVNSIAMAKVCPSAGLHVYKTVEVEGYIEEPGGGKEVLAKIPYKFIEVPKRTIDDQIYWNHYERQSDNRILVTQLKEPTAKYALKDERNMKSGLPVEASRDVVIDRSSNEVIAEWKSFTHIPGWIDRYLVYRWFGSGGMDGCNARPHDLYEFRKSILIPKK